MKKLLLLTLVSFAAIACAKKSNVTINGEIANSQDSSQIYLFYNADNKVMIDTTFVVGGKFTFNVENATNEDATISPYNVTLFLEQGEVNVKISEEGNSVTGTKSNDLMTKFFGERNSLLAEVAKLREEGKGLESEDEIKAVQEKISSVYVKIDSLTNATIDSNLAVPFAAYLASEATGINSFEAAQAYLDKFDPSLSNLSYIKNITSIRDAYEKLQPGKPAPEFALATEAGDTIKLSDFRGKVVLVDFWASWCPPCRGENPNMVKRFEKYQGSDLQMISISVDTDREAWKKAIEEDKLAWTQVIDPKNWAGLGKDYALKFIPTVVLIDKEGNIVKHNIHGEELDKKLEELLTK